MPYNQDVDDSNTELMEETGHLSAEISRKVLLELMPDQAEYSDIFVEEYCDRLLSGETKICKNREIGFITENSIILSLVSDLPAALFCAIIVEVINDFIRKNRGKNKDLGRIVKIEEMGIMAYQLAIQNGFEDSKAEEFSEKLIAVLIADLSDI